MTINWREALIWVLVPVGIQLTAVLAGFDAAAVGDWKAWGISLASLVVREAAKQLGAYLAAKQLTPRG